MATSQTDWIRVPGRDSNPAYSYYKKALDKSSLDDRDYRVIRLDNGLNATVIHDPTADKAAASLDVSIGHLYDPVSRVCSTVFQDTKLLLNADRYARSRSLL